MAPRRPLIGYVPWFDDAVDKGYTVRMRDALAAFGSIVRYEGVAATWRRHRGRLDWLVLNWTDNDLLDRRTRRVASRKVAKLFARTAALRLAAHRLVFVRHNVYPHATADGDEAAAERWVDRYERLFDDVLVHSGDARHRARRYCPHPLYRRMPAATDTPFVRALPDRYVVAFGRIVPYKRIERLFDHLPADRTLVVAGTVGDRRYAERLAACRPPQVSWRPGTVDEVDAQALVARADALVLVHADRDVIASSSFAYALSMRVPVLAIETPYLRWIQPRLGERVLRLAADAEALGRAIGEPRRPLTPDDVDAIDREFGDAAVRRALAPVFATRGRRS